MFIFRDTVMDKAALAERRSVRRVPVNIPARFFRGNMFYAVTVSDLSETGMFVQTKVYVPAGALFMLIFPFGAGLLKLAGRVRHVRRADSEIAGTGVELISPPSEYTELVMRCRGRRHG